MWSGQMVSIFGLFMESKDDLGVGGIVYYDVLE